MDGEQNQQQNEDNNNRVNAIVKIKLPKFDGSNPDIYIRIIESIFVARRITSERKKYVLTLEALETELLTKLTNFFDRGNAEPYTTLKNGLKQTFGKSSQQRLQELTQSKIDRSRRPSEILEKIKMALSLTPGEPVDNEATANLIKNLLISKLPPTHRLHLAVYQQAANENDLARIADNLFEASTDIQGNDLFEKDEAADKLEALMATKMAKLQIKVEKMEEDLKKREASQQRWNGGQNNQQFRPARNQQQGSSQFQGKNKYQRNGGNQRGFNAQRQQDQRRAVNQIQEAEDNKEEYDLNQWEPWTGDDSWGSSTEDSENFLE